ncbi:endonuclease domain-containing protein [Luedemannella helvata]|uniref:DUF559 domain-containing protein n=1 Tax=Luedemannella helvata TaxID=349315 RepID=A0ABP4X9U6_9ACTN
MPSPPLDDADDLAWLLFRQDQVISRRQALSLMSVGALRHLVDSGRWRTVQRGVLVAHTGEVTHAQRCWAAVLGAAAGGDAYLAGVSALRLAGLDGLRDNVVHVLLPAERRHFNPPRGVLVHRTATLPDEDLHRVGSPPATMPARSMVDAAQWAASDNAARTFIAMTFQRRLVTEEEVERVLRRMPTIRRRPVILRAVSEAAGGAHSLIEMEFLALCRRAGLPAPVLQVVKLDASGRRRYVDGWFEEAGVHVEIDGAQHMDVEQWWRDMRRQNDLSAAGERVLRFPSWAIRHDQETVIAHLRAALNLPPLRGPRRPR